MNRLVAAVVKPPLHGSWGAPPPSLARFGVMKSLRSGTPDSSGSRGRRQWFCRMNPVFLDVKITWGGQVREKPLHLTSYD
jgi:hypothetical protein